MVVSFSYWLVFGGFCISVQSQVTLLSVQYINGCCLESQSPTDVIYSDLSDQTLKIVAR